MQRKWPRRGAQTCACRVLDGARIGKRERGDGWRSDRVAGSTFAAAEPGTRNPERGPDALPAVSRPRDQAGPAASVSASSVAAAWRARFSVPASFSIACRSSVSRCSRTARTKAA